MPIHTLVLLGSATEGRDTALVGLLREASGEQWYAVANLLLETKPGGFAAVILSSLHLTLAVTVSDFGNEGIVSGFGGGAAIGDGIGQLPPGFPPYAHYSFGGARGAAVLSLGPTPVYYTRIVRNTFQFPTFRHSLSGPTDRDRVRYLAELLRPVSVRIDSTTSLSVPWTDERTFGSRMTAAKLELVERYERLISALLPGNRLTEAEARLLPAQIEVHVSDSRTNRSLPLPKVD